MFKENTARAMASGSDAGVDIAERTYSNFRQSFVAATQPRWPIEALTKMTALLRLPPGWDSYGGLRLRHDAAMFALTVLQDVMTAGMPEPSVVPSSTGGIQLEWHERNIDLEIHIVAPYEGEMWWLDHSTGIEKSAPLGKDLSFLHEPIAKLSA